MKGLCKVLTSASLAIATFGLSASVAYSQPADLNQQIKPPCSVAAWGTCFNSKITSDQWAKTDSAKIGKWKNLSVINVYDVNENLLFSILNQDGDHKSYLQFLLERQNKCIRGYLDICS